MPFFDTPPTSLRRTVDRWAPGIWPAFFGAAHAALRSDPGARVTSWYRDPGHNRSTPGASPDSQHLVATAFDVVPQAGSWSRLTVALQSQGFRVVPASTHLHVQVWPAGLARSSGLLAAVGA